MAASKIPVTAIIVTRNEEEKIAACLEALQAFSQLIVVDSQSADKTRDIARASGAELACFTWNHAYPKKRQWSLDTLPIAHDFVFFVDADEIVTESLLEELRDLDFSCAGYFVPGQYVWKGRTLQYGLRNHKLALMDRRKMEFPVIDDLGAPGMGEIEGHYQPVFKPGQSGKLGALKEPLLHDAQSGWEARHRRYAAWEKYMNRHDSWPRDPVFWREMAKRFLRNFPFRPALAFFHSYILKRGFLDGAAGFDFARSRREYYRMIKNLS